MKRIFNYLVGIFSVVLFTIGISFCNVNITLISLFTLFAFMILYCLFNIKERIALFLFLISFFTFLLGKYMGDFISLEQWWEPFSIETTINTIFCLFISLVTLFMGYKVKLKNKSIINSDYIKSNSNKKLRKISLLIFYFTYLPAIYVLAKKIALVANVGYLGSYLNDLSIPLILIKIADINELTFFLFISTMPSKREIRIPIRCILLYSFLSLFTGARTTTVIFLLILLFYYVYRQNIRSLDDEIWIRKKNVLVIVALVPIFIAFLSFWGSYRVGNSVDITQIGKVLSDFFESQGGSSNLISYSYDNYMKFPETNQSYTLGPVINFFKNNVFSKIFLDFEIYSQHTQEIALFGNNFSQTITYIVMPWNYFKGVGLGSSYIAELFVDFGYVGIVIFNFLLGLILSKIKYMNITNPWMMTIFLIMFKSLLTIPRNSALIFIIDAINITNIMILLIINLLVKILLSKEVRKVE